MVTWRVNAYNISVAMSTLLYVSVPINFKIKITNFNKDQTIWISKNNNRIVLSCHFCQQSHDCCVFFNTFFMFIILNLDLLVVLMIVLYSFLILFFTYSVYGKPKEIKYFLIIRFFISISKIYTLKPIANWLLINKYNFLKH